jgi:hypothetical protein
MKIKIRPLGIFEKILDVLFLPIMYMIMWLSGIFDECPQMTHYWNNLKLSRSLAPDKSLICLVKGIPGKVRKQGNIFMNALFHIPFLGGGKNYVVISPINIPEGGWYAGWHNEHVHGVSRILVNTPVRLLIGQDDCNFMGFDSKGNQILVRVVYEGKIGDGGPFRKFPLL